MTLMWSGPGRALQAHLDLFERVSESYRFTETHKGKAVLPGNLPKQLMQRCLLMSSMADLGPQVQRRSDGMLMIDGVTIGTQKDNFDIAFQEWNVARAVGQIDYEYGYLNEGVTHYVAHSVMSAIEAAAKTAPDDLLFPTDLPDPQGLIVFEYPLIIDDLDPETGAIVKGLHLPIRAIGWREVSVHCRLPDGSFEPRPGIFYTLYTDEESYVSIHIPAVQKHTGASTKGIEITSQLGMWAIDTSGWAYGLAWSGSSDTMKRQDFALGEVHSTVAFFRRFLWSYFRWTWQKLIIPTPAGLPRPDRRRFERVFNRPLEDGYVKVMRLRREVEHEKRRERGEVRGEYVVDHQWIVDGHWKWAHYATLGPAYLEDGTQNPDSHRWIQIEPYVAGNPDGPLVVGHTVKAAVR
jgi:hypothetical protein